MLLNLPLAKIQHFIKIKVIIQTVRQYETNEKIKEYSNK